MDGETQTAGRGGIANLRPPSTTEEARERGRLGGIASGVARRKRISLREELVALLEAGDGIVAKSIVASMCHEAKRGNVGAFKAIAQVLGELKEVVEMPDLPPPFTIELHDPAFVAAERKRQEEELAKTIDAVSADLPPPGGQTSGARGPSLALGTGNGPAVAPTGGGKSTERGCRAAGNAPRGADDKPHATGADASQTPSDAPSAKDEAEAWGRPPEIRREPSPPPTRPLRPSEAAAMRRAREEAAQGSQTVKPQPKAQGRSAILPMGFPKRH